MAVIMTDYHARYTVCTSPSANNSSTHRVYSTSTTSVYKQNMLSELGQSRDCVIGVPYVIFCNILYGNVPSLCTGCVIAYHNHRIKSECSLLTLCTPPRIRSS